MGYKQCGLSQSSLNPQMPVQAKFSTPFTVACAVLFGEVTLRQFKTEIILSPKVQALMRKVTVRESDEFSEAYPAHWGCRVRMELKDGQMKEAKITDASGSVSMPLTQEQIKEKALALMDEIGPEQAGAIVNQILNLADLEKMPEI